MPSRTPEEIRASIEENRKELAVSLDKLRVEAVELADWRKQLRRNQRQVAIGAAAAGFVLGGGVGAFFGLFRKKPKK